MSKWQYQVIMFAALVVGLFAGIADANAQDVGQFGAQQKQMLPMSGPVAQAPAAPAAPAQPPRNYVPGVRYTTGAVTVQGWEKTLTDGDPNLKRWNWSAMTSYTQSCYGKVPAGAYAKDKRPSGGVYVKPVHINPDTFAQKRQPFVPITARTPVRNNTPNQTASNVNGTVKFAKPAQQATPAVAKSYGSNYTTADVGGQVVAGSGSEARDVYGKLMSRNQ